MYLFVAVPGIGIEGADKEDRHYRTGVGEDQVEAFRDRRHSGAGLFEPFPALQIWQTGWCGWVPENVESVTADLQLDPGLTVRVNIVDVEEKAVAGCWVQGQRQGVGRRGTPND